MPQSPLSLSEPDTLLELDVLALSHDGRAVCRDGQRVIFVRGGLPGQRIRARLTAAKKRYAEGLCEAVLRPAPDALPAPCPHAGECGGCFLQEMPYTQQLFWKTRILAEALHRIGKLEHVPLAPIIPSPQTWGYRNKMEFAFAPDSENGLRLGLRAAGSHAVTDIRHCLLLPAGGMDVLRALRELAQESGLPAWNDAEQRGDGFWRFAVLRMPQTAAPNAENALQPQCLVSCITAPATPEQQARVASLGQELMVRLPAVTGFVHETRAAVAPVAQGERVCLRLGQTTLRERLGGVDFDVDHAGFFQVNTAAAEALCQMAADMAALTGKEQLWDLYCGVGAPGLCLAAQAASLHGVECAPAAVDMARRNAARAGLAHCRYEAGDAARVPLRWPRPDLALVDPPRAGLASGVTRALLKAHPKKIIYISCNPATLARDVALLGTRYTVERVVPIDLFPQTSHVESIVLLQRA